MAASGHTSACLPSLIVSLQPFHTFPSWMSATHGETVPLRSVLRVFRHTLAMRTRTVWWEVIAIAVAPKSVDICSLRLAV